MFFDRLRRIEALLQRIHKCLATDPTEPHWQGWSESEGIYVETEKDDCEAAVKLLTDGGWQIYGISTEARMIYIWRRLIT